MKKGKGSLKPVRYFTTVFDLKIYKGIASKSHPPRKSERTGGGRYNFKLKAVHKFQQMVRIIF